MKRVIVTGASGFVGANLARRLLSDGHRVFLLVRPEHLPWRIEAIRADVDVRLTRLEDFEALASVVEDIRPDWVFHLAVHGAYSWQTDWAQMVQTNVLGTINLVEACLRTGFDAFINTGSSSEYGFKNQAPKETDWIEPNSYYAVTKAAGTQFCRYKARERNLHMQTLRLYSVFGPYEDSNRLMPTLIARGLSGELPPLVDPEVARDYVYADDVVEAYLLAASTQKQEPGAVYNVGTGKQTSIKEVVDIARRIMGIPLEPQWGSMPNRAWDTGVWVADNQSICQSLGWQPKHTFESGFASMVDWFRANQEAQLSCFR